jgi:hypothetical protein
MKDERLIGRNIEQGTDSMIFGRASILAAVAIVFAAVGSMVVGQDGPKVGFKDTPLLPGTKWHVHDGDRPRPPIVTAGTNSTQETAGRAPSDAVVLFDGTDLSHWRGRDGKPAAWKMEQGTLVIAPGTGEILSTDEFGDCQLHLEFAAPVPPRGTDQGRGNSGVMFFGRYEIQVLDSFQNVTYADGQAAAIYGQYPPLVNVARAPGQWQCYDIIFTAPHFKADGSLESPAYVTMLHNGVLVHNHQSLVGAMAYRAVGQYKPHEPKGPILLQDHGNPVRYRNIWVRPLVPSGQRPLSDQKSSKTDLSPRSIREVGPGSVFATLSTNTVVRKYSALRPTCNFCLTADPFPV